ncbi:sensor histidine kinase [Christiangramia flava]|uniref:histidine kinase n=1 Tax=Christiangramia flava JLT2011 TaxID=1229726 RepID=A0A1L7I912_9FLAO|nr:HAMP domain-containing sensor histidine kinase [Christiangramia flava]APU70087.1 Two-component system sensor histidine kinase [Christiangramia flava JLT2011]OSS39573.1 two-component system sensor histidine kinase [Christiangramia flava JLT2011]
MNKRQLYIGVLVISVLGLFIVQYQYLRIGLNLAKVQFDRKIAYAIEDIRADLYVENQLTFLMAQSFTHDDYFRLSNDSLIDASSHFLYDYIKNDLVSNGIETDFSYRLYTRDSVISLEAPNMLDENNDQLVRYPMLLEGFLPELVEKPIILELQFHDLNTYFLSQLNGLTLPSLIFIIAIILVIIWILRSFYWQRNVITTTNDFINNFTHELKTPVFSIGLATKLLEERATPEQHTVLKMMREQVERMKKHIDKVLELGNLESRKKLFELEEQDVYPLLKKSCEDFETMARVENFQFTYELKGAEYIVKAEKFHLENAISNILDNAKKYSEAPEIALRAEKIGKHLQICIKDNGMGISAKQQQHIFKKFYRVPNGNLHRVKGYGLGLSYVSEIMKRHKGRIEMDSFENQGTTICLTLPLRYE